jgi:NAD(P)-dependent dehydrogenase (short-subunit alcohol dehydrogenase family)
MDVADPTAAERAFARASSLGPVTVLANVAGINDGCAAPHEVTDDMWERVVAVDLSGPMRLCRVVLPGMMEQRVGSIINVASIAGFRGGVSGVAYTAAKHALIGLTRSIAWMYARDGIRCNAVCPGSTRTNIAETDGPQSEFSTPRMAPIRALSPRRAPAEEVAALIAWLASDAACNVNGAIIPCDGGWTVG